MQIHQRPKIGLLNVDSYSTSKMTRVLTAHDYEVILLTDVSGETSSYYKPDLIITRFDGVTTSLEMFLQKIGCSGETPVIIVLVASRFADRERVYISGARDYICVPIIEAELLVRVQAALSPPLSGNTTPKLPLAERVGAYLLENIDQEINFSKLACMFGTNRNKLSSSFKEQFGMTIFSWLRRQRMKLAADLCIHSQLNIQQIGEAVGYSDANNFSTCFRRHFGTAPLGYKKFVLESKNFVQVSKENCPMFL